MGSSEAEMALESCLALKPGSVRLYFSINQSLDVCCPQGGAAPLSRQLLEGTNF